MIGLGCFGWTSTTVIQDLYGNLIVEHSDPYIAFAYQNPALAGGS